MVSEEGSSFEKSQEIYSKKVMDNKILVPHRIVSYLDMFISQKSNLPQYKEAVEKWKSDRAFILTYREGDKRTVKIERIVK
ncbi:MAG TPA: hypothetical protein VJY54_14660 [Lachnospiraceae bacterium]|nr:hypothetical protein [Lachnospiraceae bacterium]